MIFKLIRPDYFPKKLEPDTIYVRGYGANRAMFSLVRSVVDEHLFIEKPVKEFPYECPYCGEANDNPSGFCCEEHEEGGRIGA